jgi:hypothetical protein
MSLTLKAAKTTPIPVDFDLETDAGPIKGTFTVHAHIRDPKRVEEFAAQILSTEDAEEKTLREMVARIEGLGDESGPFDSDAAFHAVVHGPFALYLKPAVLGAYARHFNRQREGNAPRSRAR